MAKKMISRSNLNVTFDEYFYQDEKGENTYGCLQKANYHSESKGFLSKSNYSEGKPASDSNSNSNYKGDVGGDNKQSYPLEMSTSISKRCGEERDPPLHCGNGDELLYRHSSNPSVDGQKSMATPRRLPPISNLGTTVMWSLKHDLNAANNAKDDLNGIEVQMKELLQNKNDNRALSMSASKVNFMENQGDLNDAQDSAKKKKMYVKKRLSNRKSTSSRDFLWSTEFSNLRRKSHISGNSGKESVHYAPTYRMEPQPGRKFRQEMVSRLVRKVVDKLLGDYKYSPKGASSKILTLCEVTLQAIKHDMLFPRYKHVVHVSLAQKLGQGLVVADRALWARDTDHVVVVKHVAAGYVCVVTVHGVYFE